MSQYPQYPQSPGGGYQPIPYGQPGTPGVGPRRPTSVSVLAGFGIALGAMGLLGVLFSLAQVYGNFGPPNPAMKVMREQPVLAVWTPISTVIGGGLIAALLFGSIAALSLKEWGRKAMLIYAAGTIVMGTVGLAINVVYLLPAFEQMAKDTPEARMMAQLMPITTIGGFVVGLILPVCILYFLTRPHVKAAFAPPGAAGAWPR